ncbi:hypothetical protein Tco_1571805 [Tanacetum coccineum]
MTNHCSINLIISQSIEMANLLEDIQCAGSDTRPPMLDRTDFASWQQQIRLYCRGKENGVNILKSIDEGPFQMRTFQETLAEGIEGALHLGPEQNMRNIKMTMSRMQLNLKFVNNMLPEWGRFVTVLKLNLKFMNNMEWGRFVTAVKLNRGLRDSNYDQLYDYLKQHEAHANENKMMLDQFTQHIVDHLALMSNGIKPQFKTAGLLFRMFKVDRIEDKGTMRGVQMQLVMGGLRTELGMLI